MRAREGDIIESIDNLVFDVKGLVHPPSKVIAFPRFFPDPSGSRTYRGASYKKVYGLPERFEFLERNFPRYIVDDPVFDERLCEVPFEDVKEHYNPTYRLQQLRSSKSLDELETLALDLASLLKQTASVSWQAIGISGSVMLGLQRPSSDIDLVVYGSKDCLKVYSVLEGLLSEKQGSLRRYVGKDLEGLFDFRSKDTAMNYEDFVRSESRKVMQGKFLGTDYFIRFVKDWDEVHQKYGDTQFVNIGYAKVKATVVEDSESVFTPCVYRIKKVHVLEGPHHAPVQIASFRGRFCEQARNGEVIIAQGKVEQVIDNVKDRQYFRLLIGNNRSDYMILA